MVDNGNPCFGCTMRTPTCHRKGECTNTPTYEEWRVQHEKELAEARERQQKERLADWYSIEQFIKKEDTIRYLKKKSFSRGHRK